MRNHGGSLGLTSRTTLTMVSAKLVRLYPWYTGTVLLYTIMLICRFHRRLLEDVLRQAEAAATGLQASAHNGRLSRQ